MINEEGDVPTLSSDKATAKPIISPEDAIEIVCEQDYTENVSQRSRRNIRQLATSTPLARRSIFRPKSPADRSFNCPKLTRCKLYQWRAIDSIRKTKSSEVPGKHRLVGDNWQPRTETVSSPHLNDNGGKSSGSIDEENLKHKRQQRIHLNRSAICFDNLRWICAFFNSVILILSVLYFGSALSFTFSEEILSLVMTNKVYISLVVSFYIVSFFLWLIAISGFYVIWKISRKVKIHAFFTLTFGVLTLSAIFLQNSAQQYIESDVETQMLSSLKSGSEDFVKDSWDYFHSTFKCCGVTGFLDWCHQENPKSNETRTESFLGTFVCSIPSSCCTREYKNSYANESKSCIELLELGKMRNLGCIGAVKKEIYHLGKMYKILTGGAGGILLLLSIMSVALFSCLKR